MKEEFYYPSFDKETSIHAVAWVPEQEVKAVLQISHGMVEYIDRYDTFATWLSERGFYVTGNDHLGHGKSIASEENYGFFHEPDGNRCVIEDIHQLRECTEERLPGVPYFMLGHSMGSFLLRQYILKHGRGLAGAVIMGTGDKGRILLEAGQVLCRIFAMVKGWHYRSRLIDSLGLGSYNKKFEPSESKKEWVTSDTEIRKAYEADPVSIFGGIVALNDKVEKGLAEKLSKIFLEIIIAPDFSEEALEILTRKKNIRLMKLDTTLSTSTALKYTNVNDGLLVQEMDTHVVREEDLRCVTNRKPTKEEIEQLLFGWKVVKHVKSNAIVLVKDNMTIGVGAGQMNRVGAAKIAIEQAQEKAKGSVMASDAFFPMPDTVQEAIKAGVTAIIQPGGSIKDQLSIDECNEHGIAMVFTGIRHFKH